MITIATPLNQIRQLGLEALLEKLGMVRFLQQFETGHGDYTSDREQWLGETDLDALLKKGQQDVTEPATP